MKLHITPFITYEAAYQPNKVTRYTLAILCGGREIPGSPFEVNGGPCKEYFGHVTHTQCPDHQSWLFSGSHKTIGAQDVRNDRKTSFEKHKEEKNM